MVRGMKLIQLLAVAILTLVAYAILVPVIVGLYVLIVGVACFIASCYLVALGFHATGQVILFLVDRKSRRR